MGKNKPISEDLRVRVLAMYRDGATAAEAAAHFGVCQRSVYRWDKLQKERGTLASGHARSGRKSKIVVDKRFEEFAKATAYKTLQAMADYWNQQAEEQVIPKQLNNITLQVWEVSKGFDAALLIGHGVPGKLAGFEYFLVAIQHEIREEVIFQILPWFFRRIEFR